LKVVFAGTPEFAARHLEALLASPHQVTSVITQPDKPGKRGKKLIPSPVKLVAQTAGIEVMQPKRLGIGDLAEPADIMVVVAYGQILKPAVLAQPKLGAINIHASLLPRWRGAAPIQRAILAGDPETGITVIQMDEGLDTGDMLNKHAIPIALDETTASLTEKLAEIGPSLLIETLDAIEAGSLMPVAQPAVTDSYAQKIGKEEALIDWTQSSERVDRHIRAFNPEPIAYSYLGQMRVRIHSASIVTTDKTRFPVLPGSILTVTTEGVLVACQENALLISGIQLPIGKGSILSGRDILNARSDVVQVGACLTSAPTSSSTQSSPPLSPPSSPQAGDPG
jgi:methionyl-tRNA formyltransferase